MSLNNLANRLSYLGEREEALATAREAADLYRALAAQRPDAFRPDLAMSLNNLANRLSDLGEREAALAAARGGGGLYRALAAQRPDAFRPDLARSLNNLAANAERSRRREAALAAAREAVDLIARWRCAARRVPARSGRVAEQSGEPAERSRRREAALAAAREAVELYRALAAQRPDAFRPDLATSLMVRALCLDAADQPAPALADNVEAIGVLNSCLRPTAASLRATDGGDGGAYRQRCEKHGTDRIRRC